MFVISSSLIQAILERYSLPWYGTHGVSHWARVYENGLRLAEVTGANVAIVQLFAVLHDSKRVNETVDFGHGQRGAKFATSLRGTYFDLTDEEFKLLYEACAYHTDGKTEGNITIQTCWDADRLDLARAMIHPKPRHLCTGAAKNPEIISWANQRSSSRFIPGFVYQDWLPSMADGSRETTDPQEFA